MTAIRLAELADIEALSRLEAEVFGPNAWSAVSVADELAAGCALVSTTDLENATGDKGASGEEVVGYAVLRVAGEVADISRIAIRPTYRRQGRAAGLVLRLLELARQRGCERVLLEVASYNEAALRLYATLGFVTIDLRPRYYPDGGDALVLKRLL